MTYYLYHEFASGRIYTQTLLQMPAAPEIYVHP